MIASLAALAITTARAQQDLDAGKTGPQLFAQDCVACHRSPQGLAKTVSGGALVSFLRQHYTSSATSAGAVAAYLQAAGPGPRNERQKDQGKQAAPSQQPADRARLARPEPPNTIPSGGRDAATQTPAAQPGAPAPGAQTPSGAKQHERLARPGTPAAEQGAVDQRGRPLRKSRRAARGEQAAPAGPASGEPEAAPQAGAEAAPAATAGNPAAGAAGPATAAPAAPAAATRPPGFSEPLP